MLQFLEDLGTGENHRFAVDAADWSYGRDRPSAGTIAPSAAFLSLLADPERLGEMVPVPPPLVDAVGSDDVTPAPPSRIPEALAVEDGLSGTEALPLLPTYVALLVYPSENRSTEEIAGMIFRAACLHPTVRPTHST
jgi:hypothetical protein